MALTQKLPWYDSYWLLRYLRAKEFLTRDHPSRVDEFVAAFAPLRTRPNFRERLIDGVFDEAALEAMRSVARSFRLEEMATHEVATHGRLVVHDHAAIDALQTKLIPRVEELVEESVESTYNFVALYMQRGVCRVHLDAPIAKWTLDLCLDQSVPWPIHFSDVVPWPERAPDADGDWQQRLKGAPVSSFRSYTMEPGQALVFSGSSQWHYRDGFPGTDPRGYCTLVFFHFIPSGTRELLRWEDWERRFDAPGLAAVVGAGIDRFTSRT